MLLVGVEGVGCFGLAFVFMQERLGPGPNFGPCVWPQMWFPTFCTSTPTFHRSRPHNKHKLFAFAFSVQAPSPGVQNLALALQMHNHGN